MRGETIFQGVIVVVLLIGIVLRLVAWVLRTRDHPVPKVEKLGMGLIFAGIALNLVAVIRDNVRP